MEETEAGNSPKATSGKKEDDISHASAYKLGRSVSLSRKGPEAKKSNTPSPKPKVSLRQSFRARRAKSEKVKELEDKYRNQRNVKAMTKTNRS